MITNSSIGRNGRLGNQLFQIAFLVGLSERFGVEYALPGWGYQEYFSYPFPVLHMNGEAVREKSFSYSPDYNADSDSDFSGYFQSWKYFSHCESKIRDVFKFIERPHTKTKETIGIHVRREDYVNNSNYAEIYPTYYLSALEKHFPNWRDMDILVFSDDPEYCRVHFNHPNFSVIEGNKDIEDLYLMFTKCEHFIIANSSLSWWGAWLIDNPGKKIIRPSDHFAGTLKVRNDTKDLYPEEWIEHSNYEQIDLKDVTFVIPVAYDSLDRKQNLGLSVCILQRNFNTNIIIGEQGGDEFVYMERFNCRYIKFKYPYFHRTKMLNEMTRISGTEIVVNWDADVFIPPLQIIEAVHMLKNGADVVYPYDGTFARMKRDKWWAGLKKGIDIGITRNTELDNIDNKIKSAGGVVAYNKGSFFRAGGENENYVSWGNEDAEREYRFKKLGLRVKRTNGWLYHLDHWVGDNSCHRHVHGQHNMREWDKISGMSEDNLAKYVKSWKWSGITE